MPLLRLLAFGFGGYLTYTSASLLYQIHNLGRMADAVFLYTSWRYDVSRQPTEGALIVMVIIGLGCMGWAVNDR